MHCLLQSEIGPRKKKTWPPQLLLLFCFYSKIIRLAYLNIEIMLSVKRKKFSLIISNSSLLITCCSRASQSTFSDISIQSSRVIHAVLMCKILLMHNLQIQSNLCTTNTLGIQNYWPLLTSGRCSEVIYVIKVFNKAPKW